MRIFKYVVPGNPIAETKVLDTETPRIWDEYKHKKFNFEQYLRNQHDERQLFHEPIIVEATFYFKPPKLAPKYHDNRPSLHGLYNFLDQSLKGIIYRHDCQIYETILKKIYSEDARTEIIIKRIE